MIKYISWLAIGLLLAGSPFANGGDIFRMEITSGPAVTIAGDNLQDVLARTLTYSQSAGPISGSLNYGGYRNAIRITTDPPGYAALTFPSTGFSTKITASNAPALEAQVRKFLKTGGAGQLRGLQQTITASSFIAPNDGTPHSSTALLANRAYDQFATEEVWTREERANPPPSGEPAVSVSVMPDVGRINADGYQGTIYTLPFDQRITLHKRTGLFLDLTPSYIDIEGSDIFQLAMGIGIPAFVLIDQEVPRQKTTEPGTPVDATTERWGTHWLWRVAPSVAAVGSVSEDFNTGGWIIQGSLTSLVSYDTPRFTISMGNHFSFYGSKTLSEGGYEFDPGVSQQIFKNGLHLSVPLAQRWVAKFYGIQTHFVQNVAVDNYYTVGANVIYRFADPGKYKNILTRRGYFFIGAYADLASHYSSPHIRFGSVWNF